VRCPISFRSLFSPPPVSSSLPVRQPFSPKRSPFAVPGFTSFPSRFPNQLDGSRLAQTVSLLSLPLPPGLTAHSYWSSHPPQYPCIFSRLGPPLLRSPSSTCVTSFSPSRSNSSSVRELRFVGREFPNAPQPFSSIGNPLPKRVPRCAFEPCPSRPCVCASRHTPSSTRLPPRPVPEGCYPREKTRTLSFFRSQCPLSPANRDADRVPSASGIIDFRSRRGRRLQVILKGMTHPVPFPPPRCSPGRYSLPPFLPFSSCLLTLWFFPPCRAQALTKLKIFYLSATSIPFSGTLGVCFLLIILDCLWLQFSVAFSRLPCAPSPSLVKKKYEFEVSRPAFAVRHTSNRFPPLPRIPVGISP